MLVRESQWYLDILARYHAKVNHPTYGDVRKRGNPPSVLKAVTILRGSSECRLCRSLDCVELHHVDGNWKNYTLNNLWYYCHNCHNQAHKEMRTMPTPKTRTRTVWTDERIKALRNDVNALVAKGSTKSAAFNKLTAKYNCSHFHLNRMYRYDHATIRQWTRTRNGKPTNHAVRRNVTSTAVTMTPTEAIQFYNFCRQLGITIS